MSEALPEGGHPLPRSAGRHVDRVCDQFEEAWLAGQQPPVEEYLGDTPEPERSALLRELLILDLDYRRRRGQRPTPEEYRVRFPEYRELIRTLLPDPAAGAGAPGPPGPAPDVQRTGTYPGEGEA